MGGVTQMAEHLLCRHEPLSSNPGLTKKRKKEKEKEKNRQRIGFKGYKVYLGKLMPKSNNFLNKNGSWENFRFPSPDQDMSESQHISLVLTVE
jgi:hypothetical protein